MKIKTLAGTCLAVTTAVALIAPTTASASTPFTSTKVVTSGDYVLNDFTSSITGTLVKVDSTSQVNSVTITNGTASGGYRVFDQTTDTSHLNNLIIKKVNATGFRRGFARVRDTDNVLIEDSVGIGDPTATDRGTVPGGTATSDLAVDSLTVRRTDMSNWQGTPATYTNGDGMATEELVNSLFEDVWAKDNADGGLDVKGNVTIHRAQLENNHRNLRLWGHIDASDITSINPTNAHIWVGGGTRFTGGTITRPTFIGGGTLPYLKLDASSGPGTLTIVDPTDANGNLITASAFAAGIDKEGGSQVTVVVQYSGATSGPGPVATRPTAPNLTPVTPPPPAAACGDGIDNDGDGLIDFPADPGCTSTADTSEVNPPACSDGIDNDGDGLIDFPADTGCTSATDTDESNPVVTPTVASETLTPGDTTVKVDWSLAAGTDGADGARVSRDGTDSTGAGPYTFPQSATMGSSGSQTFTRLVDGTAYNFTVQPTKGGVAIGTPVTKAATPVAPPPVIPGAPTSVTAVLNADKTITVHGTVASGTTSVDVFETVHADSNVPRTPAPVITGNTFSFTSTVRTGGTFYKYQARDCNSAGCSVRVATSPSTINVP